MLLGEYGQSMKICEKDGKNVYYLLIMGNAPDRTIDKTLMSQHQSMMDYFSKDDPLFHAEQIKFPLSTDQMKIVDATGRRVKLAGGNWSGGHMCRHCVDGL